MQVSNVGEFLTVEQPQVTILFPFESSKGKWLLYMTDQPEVVDDMGTCEVDPKLINPAGFKVGRRDK